MRDKLSIIVYSSDPEVVNTKIESGINYETPENRMPFSDYFTKENE